MKSLLLVFVLLLDLTGCISSGVLFQDGQTAGKKDSNVAFGISYNLSPSYHETDTATRRVLIKPERVPAPYFTIQGQYGLTDHLDFGGSLGCGLLSGGASLFTKYSLTPPQIEVSCLLILLCYRVGFR